MVFPVFPKGGWQARWEGGGSLFSTGPGSHYFHVADWGMERGGIMSRRYSRWRSTAEEVLCTAKLGLTKARAPPATEQSDRPQGPPVSWGALPGEPSLSRTHRVQVAKIPTSKMEGSQEITSCLFYILSPRGSDPTQGALLLPVTQAYMIS